MRPPALRRWARPLIGAALLTALAWWYPLESITDAFASLDGPTITAALTIGLATTVLCAARWILVARGVGLRLPWGRAVGDYYRAVLLNAVLPSGILGDVHRALGHGRYAGDLPRGVRAVILERAAGQVVLAAAGATLLFTLPAALLGPGLFTVAVSLALPALVAAVMCLRRVPALTATIADVRAGLFTTGTGPGVLLLSVAALAGHVTLFLVAAHAAGVTAPAFSLLPLAIAALLAMSVPANIGGWGPREAVTALTFGAAGLGSATGLTVSVLYGLLALVAALPGVFVLLWRLLPVERVQVPGEGPGKERQQVTPLVRRGARR